MKVRDHFGLGDTEDQRASAIAASRAGKVVLSGVFGGSLNFGCGSLTSASGKASKGLTAEEKAAMRETIRERKSPGGEKEVLAKIAKMSGSDRAMAKRIHRIVTETAPDLKPRTWYGMPAYANKDGKVVCFF